MNKSDYADIEALEPRSAPKNSVPWKKRFLLAIPLILALYYYNLSTNKSAAPPFGAPVCPIYDITQPANYEANKAKLDFIINDETFKNASVQKLSGAVQVDTEVYDLQPDVADAPELWTKFAKFHQYLETTFPLIYENLKVEKVNTYGLFYTWKGADDSLKPILLMAHQDVVPVQVDTIKDWSYSPFSGHYDGELIYGRGVSDCKNLLIAHLEAIEELIKDGFNPKRTVLISYGFDEEAFGVRGASNLGQFVLERYGQDSLYAIVDEGSGGITKVGETYFASPATGEKGYLDVILELTTPGGHSSVPPDHTSIGIVGDLLKTIEEDPYEPILTPANPFFGYMQCVAEHSDSLDPELRSSIFRAAYDKVSNSKVIKYISESKLTKYLIRTSQAIDIIKGGAKVNALPEHVEVYINHRVAIESSIGEVYSHFESRVSKIAEKYDLGFISQDKELIEPSPNGYFNVYYKNSLEPAPVSPSSGPVWETFSGSIRHLLEDIILKNSTNPVVVTPSIMTGNTDTQWYWHNTPELQWKLTDNVYRYIPYLSTLEMINSGVHSVNERLEFNTHLQVIAFYYEYLQIVSEVEDK